MWIYTQEVVIIILQCFWLLDFNNGFILQYIHKYGDATVQLCISYTTTDYVIMATHHYKTTTPTDDYTHVITNITTSSFYHCHLSVRGRNALNTTMYLCFGY